MDKFLALPQERQDKIATAAMSIFGTSGYKKAYVSEIAAAAGISKALVFHYFGTKKTLYLYLLDYTSRIMSAKAQKERELSSTDVFDRLVDAAKQKIFVMSRYPEIRGFLTSIYNEDDPEVMSEVKELLASDEDMLTKIVIEYTDEKKLKDGIDPMLVECVLLKFTEGTLGNRLDKTRSLVEIMFEYTKCLNMLKHILYKEEFLK